MATISLKMFGHLVASALVPAVWCVDNSQLLRQESDTPSDHSVGLSSQRNHSHGLATLEPAGEATVTWAQGQRDQQAYPSARAATPTEKGARAHGYQQHHHDRQHAASSDATLEAMPSMKKPESNVPAELVQRDGDGLRRCTLTDFEGEQGPGDFRRGSNNGTWDIPLQLPRHTSPDCSYTGGSMFQSTGPSAAGPPRTICRPEPECGFTTFGLLPDWNVDKGPAYWFVKFKDGEKHDVSHIHLWNRDTYRLVTLRGFHVDGDGLYRLNKACVRFTVDGVKPSEINPTENCDLNLPDISSDEAGTVVPINRSIAGMMIISVAETGFMSICGAQIYERTTTTTTTTTPQRYETTITTESASEQTEESNVGYYVGVTLVVVLVLVLAVIACVGVGVATGAIGGGGGRSHHHHEDWREWQEGGNWGGNAGWNDLDWSAGGPSGHDIDRHSGHTGRSHGGPGAAGGVDAWHGDWGQDGGGGAGYGY